MCTSISKPLLPFIMAHYGFLKQLNKNKVHVFRAKSKKDIHKNEEGPDCSVFRFREIKEGIRYKRITSIGGQNSKL